MKNSSTGEATMFADGAGAEDVKRIAILIAIVAAIAFSVGAWMFLR